MIAFCFNFAFNFFHSFLKLCLLLNQVDPAKRVYEHPGVQRSGIFDVSRIQRLVVCQLLYDNGRYQEIVRILTDLSRETKLSLDETTMSKRQEKRGA